MRRYLSSQFGLPVVLAVAVIAVASIAFVNWKTITNAVTPPRQLPGLELVTINPGNYDLTVLLPNSLRREYFQKHVEIKRAFQIGRYEITIDQWNVCFKEGGCRRKAIQRPYQKGDHPVTRVSWHDAYTFTKWLSHRTRQSYRLPTEEEWAFAAFTGQNVTKDTIENLIKSRKKAQTSLMTKFRRTRAIGGNGKNTWNISDVTGSVWEWTLTCRFSSDQKNRRPWTIKELSNPALCPNRVVQGDERAHVPFFVDDVYAGGCGTGAPVDNIGFRVVKEIP